MNKNFTTTCTFYRWIHEQRKSNGWGGLWVSRYKNRTRLCRAVVHIFITCVKVRIYWTVRRTDCDCKMALWNRSKTTHLLRYSVYAEVSTISDDCKQMKHLAQDEVFSGQRPMAERAKWGEDFVVSLITMFDKQCVATHLEHHHY